MSPKGSNASNVDERDGSVRKTTVRMVETHLTKQRSAYDAWIADLCRDAEDSAAERDRLKAKLKALRDDEKRRVLKKILVRLCRMQHCMAWSRWRNAATRMRRATIEREMSLLDVELSSNLSNAQFAEDEAERRADEAAALAFGSASDSQRKLVLKILNKLCSGLARAGWNVWWKQAFYHKHCQKLMSKIIKRLYNSQLAKGWNRWAHVASKWSLVIALEVQKTLRAELVDSEAQAKHFEAEADRRAAGAAQSAVARASAAQKDLLVKMMGQMCGNYLMMGWSVWKSAVAYQKHCVALLTRIFVKLLNIKKFTCFRYWHHVVFDFEKDAAKLRQSLLQSQKDNLERTLRERSAQLAQLQQEAARLLHMSEHAAKETQQVMALSDAFLDQLNLVLDPKWLEKKEQEKAVMAMQAEFEGAPPGYGAAPGPDAPPAQYR
ncbi:hypothetical protein M885DRAFT_516564 [Pelagophyceae sp. CCMP2097]|nr:hypothetical protein M885DRAFT_516564 [Pelagophyceae sp. CCMP2097]